MEISDGNSAEIDVQTSAIISRLKKEIRKAGGAKIVAEKAGVAPGTLTKNLSADTKIALETVVKVAAALSLDMGELFRSGDPMSGMSQTMTGDTIPPSQPTATGNDAPKAPVTSAAIDPLLMEKLYKAVERAYRDMGQKPPGHRLALEATTLFNVLLSRVTDVRDTAIVDAVVPVLARELVERLKEAAADPGSGKRSAS